MIDEEQTGSNIKKEELGERESVLLKENKEDPKSGTPKKKNTLRRYVINISLILGITAFVLWLSLKDNFNDVVNVMSTADIKWLFVIGGIMVIYYATLALIIFIFARLYTKKYGYHQALANIFIGEFYNGVTPTSSGGQVMQAYTFKKQGVEISNAASIMVMNFILFQIVLIGYGLLALIFKGGILFTDNVKNLGPFGFEGAYFYLPLWVFVFVGFLVNLAVIGFLFLMSYSHRVHNFIMNHGISVGAKLHLVKNPEKTKNSLRIQVENFKIELRRLQSNTRVAIVIMFLFFIVLTCKFCIPYFAGLALNAYNVDTSTGFSKFWDSVFLSCFHQMSTGLIPLPGSAGSSEYFFNKLFGATVTFAQDGGYVVAGYYDNASNLIIDLTKQTYSDPVTPACLLSWRLSTFHIPLIISGFVSAFYKSRPRDEEGNVIRASRETFVTLQLTTYEERKKSSDTMFETKRLNDKEVLDKIKSSLKPNKKDKSKSSDDSSYKIDKENKKVEHKKAKKPSPNSKKDKKKDSDSGWDTIDTGDE